MIKIKQILYVICLIVTNLITAQSIDINGLVIADEDLEGIHIINKTASKFTITNEQGAFVIPAKLNDTIIISAIKYKAEERIVTQNILEAKTLTVYLSENVNELDEVIIGKVLTGNLLSDIQNSDAKRDINFYDLGIPGYTGKRKTQTERRLYEATTGGGIVPLNPILNWISGRTKQLKNHVKLEKQDVQMDKAISDFSDMLFEIDDLQEDKRMEFFYFSSEDQEFMQIAKVKDDIKMLEFLQRKLIEYKENVTSSQD